MNRQHDEAMIVILGIDQASCVARGKQIRTSSWYKILPIFRRAEFYLLYGHVGLPFDIVPGTPVLDWHNEMKHHIEWGRIVPVRQFTQRIINPQPQENNDDTSE